MLRGGVHLQLPDVVGSRAKEAGLVLLFLPGKHSILQLCHPAASCSIDDSFTCQQYMPAVVAWWHLSAARKILWASLPDALTL